MKILKLNNVHILAGILLLSIFSFSCKDEDRYDPDTSIISDKTLMELIKANDQLSAFSSMLEGTGYDKVLSGDQTYTVWAPNNEAISGLAFETGEDSLKFIKNHTARFLQGASGSFSKKVYMENMKLIPFGRTGLETYSFGGMELIDKNISAANGILHTLGGSVPYTRNIWEKMEEPGFDSIRNYLYAQTTKRFSPSLSKEIGLDEGYPLYDSVFVETNPFWYEVASNINLLPSLRYLGGIYHVNQEDSLYTMILPTNEAWKEAYDRMFPHFANNAEDNPDSVQRYYTAFSIVQDLVFRGLVDGTENNLTSTRSTTFESPAGLFEGAIKEDVSNGRIFKTDKLKYNSWESWNKPIKIEAEIPVYRNDPTTGLLGGRVHTDFNQYPGIEISNMYVYAATTASTSPIYIDFYLPSVLAAEYDIYCVFIPDSLRFPLKPMPTKVRFSVQQLNRETNRWQIIKSGGGTGSEITPSPNEVSATKVTKMLVAEKFKFPYMSINEEPFPLKIRVATTITSPREINQFSNRMGIDYILLEPVKD
ncbi:MAG: fasciclin domain-containing protein [Dysgonamonadaceae bacterium]|jgi:hypothetical protein|nr:fasciclin domain-containing protein [Dysgonamonadaceae bacterium]